MSARRTPGLEMMKLRPQEVKLEVENVNNPALYSVMSTDAEKGTDQVEQKKPSGAGYAFKTYCIISMTIVWSSYAIMVRYTRIAKDKPMYHSTTVIVLSEFTKFWIAVLLLYRTHHFQAKATLAEIRSDFFGKPRELIKMSVPSIVYAVQNNLDFVALQNLEPGVYQVTTQLKVVTTAVFMVLLLQRRYSLTRWIAILGLFAGVALVQLDASGSSHADEASMTTKTTERKQNYALGITAVLITCVTAGFAGVYFEKMLKNSDTSLWIRNMQMYFCGFISGSIGCAASEGSQIMQDGFFYGYYSLIYLIVLSLSVGGIFISMVMKYLDNLYKSFAAAVSISLVCVISWHVFGTALGMYFVLGTAIVCGSIVLYNYVSE